MTVAKRKKARKAARRTAKKSVKRPAAKPVARPKDKTLAVVGLVLNVLILPGLGTIVMGKIRTGVWQVVLVLGGGFLGIGLGVLALVFISAVIGIPLILLGIIAFVTAWIWALVTSIKEFT